MRATPVIRTAEPRKPSSLFLESPSSSENDPSDETPIALTVTAIRVIIRGSAPSVDLSIRFGPDRSAAGTEIIVGGVTATSTTTGDVFTTLTNPLIPANSHIWMTITALTGTVVSIRATVVYA